MVAANVRLPNVRKMFVPDPGYVICDADLSGADAQIVAWEANEPRLKKAFKAGMKIHIVNARDMWPERTKDMTNDELKNSRLYKEIKGGVHATNYGASYSALMLNFKWDAATAMRFQEQWFTLNPGIKHWHQRYGRHLQGTQCWNCENAENILLGAPCPACGSHLGRTVKNKFGFRRMYFDRVDHLLPEALAWTPQSSVIFASEIGWVIVCMGYDWLREWGYTDEELAWYQSLLVNPQAAYKWAGIPQFLIQVHDSIVFQVPKKHEDDIPEIVKDMQVRIPYDDPLVIPLGFGISDRSWGDCG